jgi:hypothetical protein
MTRTETIPSGEKRLWPVSPDAIVARLSAEEAARQHVPVSQPAILALNLTKSSASVREN